MKSLRLQLLTRILGVIIAALVMLTLFSYYETSHEIEEVFDAELAQTARMISQMTLANIDSKGEDGHIELPPPSQERGHKYEKHISYQIWYRNALVLHSDSAPNTPLTNTTGYQDIEIDGRIWRVFGLHPKGTEYRIYTAEDKVARKELSLEMLVESLGIFFWSLPVIGILIYLTISRGLVSLDRLSSEVRARDINQLQPLDQTRAPREVLPLIDALNTLLARLDAAMSRERQFTSDASHELRTPLAGIRLHAQLAMKTDDEAERRHSLEQILRAIDQSTHLVEQMLTLTRLEPDNFHTEKQTVDLYGLCRDIVADAVHQAQSKAISVTVETDPPETGLTLQTNANLLRIVLRNLLDNALRYSAEHSSIHLLVRNDADTIHIEVQDQGPGIPPAQIERVTDRFIRLAGQDVPGCGLGLSIATQAAEQLGAQLQLVNRHDGPGLIARISLPGPAGHAAT